MKLNSTQSLLGGIVSLILALSCCWLPFLVVAIGGASSMIAFSEGVEKFSGAFMSVGGLFLTWGGYQLYQKQHLLMKNTVVLDSTITCPKCAFSKEEKMPTNACQFFYECTSCKTILKPKAGDCCVYCSYGTVVCPPIQEGKNCC